MAQPLSAIVDQLKAAKAPQVVNTPEYVVNLANVKPDIEQVRANCPAPSILRCYLSIRSTLSFTSFLCYLENALYIDLYGALKQLGSTRLFHTLLGASSISLNLLRWIGHQIQISLSCLKYMGFLQS